MMSMIAPKQGNNSKNYFTNLQSFEKLEETGIKKRRESIDLGSGMKRNNSS